MKNHIAAIPENSKLKEGHADNSGLLADQARSEANITGVETRASVVSMGAAADTNLEPPSGFVGP